MTEDNLLRDDDTGAHAISLALTSELLPIFKPTLQLAAELAKRVRAEGRGR